MPDLVLWRRLTKTDFKAIHGKAAPSGSGGGAVHIALAAPREGFRLDEFLRRPGSGHIELQTAKGPGHAASALNFLSNPSRRGGEWIIQDQFRGRHPAWKDLPKAWNDRDEPVVFVFRVGSRFHVRWMWHSRLRAFAGRLPDGVFASSVGIGEIEVEQLPEFKLSPQSALDRFEETGSADDEPFDPSDLIDGRKRVFRAIRLRQGQPKFRSRLLTAYGRACAFTGERTLWVLEAAHIVPYLGPKTNHVTNGLLLRSDVHTLFDLGLIAVHPASRTLRVARRLESTPYDALKGQPLREPRLASNRASQAALEAHFATFEDN